MWTESLCAEIVALCADIHRAEYRLLSLIETLDAAKSYIGTARSRVTPTKTARWCSRAGCRRIKARC
jgi:hypothetical protein